MFSKFLFLKSISSTEYKLRLPKYKQLYIDI